jgi:hypothetical protein
LCRFHVPDEDFEFARKSYEWPKHFAEVLREAGTKAAAEHRQFQAALKVRRKEFEQQVEQYVAKLAVVEGRSDIVKRQVAVAEVRMSSEVVRMQTHAHKKTQPKYVHPYVCEASLYIMLVLLHIAHTTPSFIITRVSGQIHCAYSRKSTWCKQDTTRRPVT